VSVYSGRAAGSFGALGGRIEFFWKPDPEILARRIMTLAGYLENFKPPLEASREVARADMENHFDTESGPEGAWAPLADATIERWGEHPILQLTLALRGAATADTAFPVDANDLFFSTAGLPFYWKYVEEGRGGSAEDVEFAKAARKMFEDAGKQVPARFEQAAYGGMPARPFIGISQEAQDLIVEVFDAWFEGGISGFYVHGTGTVQTLGPGGFGPGMTLSRE
jgi:hypothetical protein